MKKEPSRKKKKKAAPKHKFTRGLYGWITHTDGGRHDRRRTRPGRCADRVLRSLGGTRDSRDVSAA